MRDDVILDAVVYLTCDNAAIEEFVFREIGPITNDARCPGARHARYGHKLINTGRADVDALFRWREGTRAGLGRRGWMREICPTRRKLAT
jgi:hypothetical protein